MAKRILIYTNHFYPENFKINEIATFFKNEGNYVTVITGLPNYPNGKVYDGFGVFKSFKEKNGNQTVYRLPLITRGRGNKIRLVLNYLTYFFSTLFFTFYLILRKKRFDIVFVHHTSPIFIAFHPILIKFFHKKTKLILWDLDIWPDTLIAVNILSNKKILNLIEKIVKFIYSFYDTILVGSKSFIEIVQKRTIDKTVLYFPNWAEDVFTSRKLQVFPEVKLVEDDKFVIMFAGNIAEAQDVKNIFNAALLLKNVRIKWVFIGDGRMKKWLVDKVNSNRLKSHFEFFENQSVEYMPYFFKKADVMLISLKDQDIFKKTVPAKLQAYMSFGKPILGMLSGEPADIINQSRCGWVCKSGDYEELAEIIKSILILDKNRLEFYGENAKKYYEKNFSKKERFSQLKCLLN